MPIRRSPASILTHENVSRTLNELATAHTIERIWTRDHTLWHPDPTEIDNRLGWLTVLDQMRDGLTESRAFAQAAREAHTSDVVLLGMGGSSLGPEVLRCTFGSARGYPRLWVLDSTVPGWVRAVTSTIQPARTLFLVASKSGGTVEVMSLFAHFWELVQRTKGNRGGAQFVAITDPGTGLEALAQHKGFWRTFTNPPDIGGRYSVLSYFGLVPAALLGMDVGKLLARADAMREACRRTAPAQDNPGAALGFELPAVGKSLHDDAVGLDAVELVLAARADLGCRVGARPVHVVPRGERISAGRERLRDALVRTHELDALGLQAGAVARHQAARDA